MSRLALLATLLMVCAPLVSRELQAWREAGMVPGAAAGQHAMAGMAMPMDMAGDMDMDMSAMAGMQHHPDTTPAPHASMGGHDMDAADMAMHGFACDYCVLAARLLPWLVLALLVLPLLRAPALAPIFSVPVVLAARWPAHAARGPPASA